MFAFVNWGNYLAGSRPRTAAAAAQMGRGAPDGVPPSALPAVEPFFWVLNFQDRARAHPGCLQGRPHLPLCSRDVLRGV